MPDSLSNILIIPQFCNQDSIFDMDLDHALAAQYATDGIDVEALCTEVPPTPPPPPAWQQGLEGIPRSLGIGDNSGVLALITGIIVLMMLSYKNSRRLFATLFRELLGMRRRANLFDERTSNETQVLWLMALQWSVYTGLVGYTYLSRQFHLPDSGSFVHSIMVIGLMGCYYVFQRVAYEVVGYTFSTNTGKRYFVQGFTASQSLLGFLLAIPALVALFYPGAALEMIGLSAGLYFLARIIFIIKGFRIFYHKFSSLLYFILYLCTLEIIPLIVLYKCALFLVLNY